MLRLHFPQAANASPGLPLRQLRDRCCPHPRAPCSWSLPIEPTRRRHVALLAVQQFLRSHCLQNGGCTTQRHGAALPRHSRAAGTWGWAITLETRTGFVCPGRCLEASGVPLPASENIRNGNSTKGRQQERGGIISSPVGDAMHDARAVRYTPLCLPTPLAVPAVPHFQSPSCHHSIPFPCSGAAARRHCDTHSPAFGGENGGFRVGHAQQKCAADARPAYPPGATSVGFCLCVMCG